MPSDRINVRRIFAFEATQGDVLLEIHDHPDPPTVHRGTDGKVTVAYKQVVDVELGHWDEPELGEDTPDPHPNANIGIPVGEVVIRTVGHENGLQVHDEPCPWRVRALHVIEVCHADDIARLWEMNGRLLGIVAEGS